MGSYVAFLILVAVVVAAVYVFSSFVKQTEEEMDEYITRESAKSNKTFRP